MLILPPWKEHENPLLSGMLGFSKLLNRISRGNPGYFPDLHSGSLILCVSDYSGEEKKSLYSINSFLFINLEGSRSWNEKRKYLREVYLGDKRRISFKNLSDKKRRKALVPFLENADGIPGIIITVAIDKKLKNLFFEDPEPKDWQKPPEGMLLSKIREKWKKDVFSKLMATIHLVSFFFSGLSRPGQDIYWFSDKDQIMANPARIREATEIFAHIFSHYLTHDFRHMKCGTTIADDGTMLLQDLVSITDLAAGAFGELLTRQRHAHMKANSEIGIPLPENLTDKTKLLTFWLSQTFHPLKRLNFVIEPRSPGLNFQWYQIHAFSGFV